jgi:hypothetical protein
MRAGHLCPEPHLQDLARTEADAHRLIDLTGTKHKNRRRGQQWVGRDARRVREPGWRGTSALLGPPPITVPLERRQL